MNTKAFIIVILTISCLIFVSCTKNVVNDPLQFQIELLSGTGRVQNTQRIWQLDSTIIDDKKQDLSIYQKQYKRTFTYNGLYNDTDNNTGKWEITTLNKLKLTISYYFNNKVDIILYDIISIDLSQLKLTYKNSNGQTITHVFKLAN